jgi:photosystem II stability/assembly factor-like uncharacterized protein
VTRSSIFALALLASVSTTAVAWSAPAPKAAAASAATAAPTPDPAGPFEGLKYRLVGPFRGGRATGVSGVAGDPNTFYFGAAAGGVWKTTDAGVTWKPLWDKFPEASPAVGAIAVAQSDPKIVYVGTGETNIRGNVVMGNGLYKSTDAGKTWHFSGLRDTQVIGRIIVDPKNPDSVYVAALGHLFGENDERGIFHSVDGGKTWKKVLYVDNKTGGVDVAFDPSNPKIMWAGMWQAYRKPWIMESGGPGSGLYRSTDGGETWTRQSGGGLPEGIYGRINVAPTSNPNRIYAMIEAKKGGLYRSDDAGKTWALINDRNDYRQRAWYFNTVFADPKNPDVVYVMNTSAYRSTDAGKTFKSLHTRHGDDHELWIDPTDTKRMVNSNDGGGTVTVDGGETWSSQSNQPTAQFYHVATDDAFPYHLYGSQQDSGTVDIATAGREGQITAADWQDVGGGESGFVVPDPTDSNVVYADSYDSDITRYNKKTDAIQQITPWPWLNMGWAPKDLTHRFQWTAPIMISRFEPHAVYFAAEVLYKTTDGGRSWAQISPDLTRNDKTKQEGSGGPLTKDNTSIETYDTIFDVAESPLDKNMLWVGSDDGLVHLTRDGGAHWADVTPKGLPEWATVQVIEPDAHNPAVAYMAADRHRLDDPRPYIFKTSDYGQTWTQITDGIPADAYAHVVRADPTRAGLLYAGTELGLYISYDDGAHWRPFQLNLPITPVHDLVIHGDSLAVATHGRAFWVLDDLTPIRQWSPEVEASKAHLFTPAVANHTVFGGRGPSLENGANPPGGAVISYWLSPSVGTARPLPDAKPDDKKDDKKKEAFDPLDSRIKLEILDSEGRVVRAFPEPPIEATKPKSTVAKGDKQPEEKPQGEEEEGPKPIKVPHLAGMNSFVWDLRYAGALPIPHEPLWAASTAGPKALPGRYQVRLTVDGVSQTQPLEIAPDPRGITTAEALRRQFDLHEAINEEVTTVHRAVLDIVAARGRIASARAAAKGKPDEAKVDAAANALEAKLVPVEEALYQPRSHAGEDALNFPVKLDNQIAALGSYVGYGDDAPTEQEAKMFVELKGQADSQLATWEDIKAHDLAAFDRMTGR